MFQKVLHMKWDIAYFHNFDSQYLYCQGEIIKKWEIKHRCKVLLLNCSVIEKINT